MLYRIASLDDVWIDVALREQDAGAIRVGSRAAVELASYPGRPVNGRIAYVYPTLDQATRAVRARVEIPNPAGRFKLGMYATVILTTPSRRALTVPASAVLNTGERTLVFMDMGGGSLMPMDVVAGRTAGGYTEILSGVEPGQRVVTSAQYLFDSESNLAEVMGSMIGQMNMSDMNRTGGMKDTSGTTDKGAGMKDMDMPGMKAPPTATTPRR
jgi:RND family efflux transporter MFP subunit